MRTLTTFCIFSFSVLAAANARAEPFTILPNGELVFNATLTTQGVFTCVPAVACAGSGTNSVTLGSGASMSTLTFTGVDTTLQIGNTATPVVVGTVESSATTSGFTFPTRANPNDPILLFALSMTHASPVAATDTIRWSFGPGGNPELPLLEGGSYVSFPAGPNPPGFHYTFLIYTFHPFPFSLPGNGVRDITADVGAVPEPATLVLLGTGLALSAAGARRRCR